MSSEFGYFDFSNMPSGTMYTRDTDGFEVSATMRSAKTILLFLFSVLFIGGLYSETTKSREPISEGWLLICVLIIIFLVSLSLMTTWGRVTISVRGNSGTVFVGLGPLGWRRRFLWSDIHAIREGKLYDCGVWYHDYGDIIIFPKVVVLEGRTKIDFGWWLSKRRRRFVIKALKHAKLYYPYHD